MNIQFAKSKAGHDKDQLYFILKVEEEFVYLVNGTTRPLDKPKKKRKKACAGHTPDTGRTVQHFRGRHHK